MDDVRRTARRGAAFLAFMLMIAAPCASQVPQRGSIAPEQARSFRVVPSLITSSVVVREPLRARADGVQPAAVAPPKVDKQGRGALIGAGIGAFAGLAFGIANFHSGDGLDSGKLTAITTVLGAVLGMAIGASASL